jgi:hypothetical protein
MLSIKSKCSVNIIHFQGFPKLKTVEFTDVNNAGLSKSNEENGVY